MQDSEITIGRIVHYSLSQRDAEAIEKIRDQLVSKLGSSVVGPGETVRAGEVFPAIAVKQFGPKKASLQVLMDGPEGSYWAPQRIQGEGEGQYLWPEFSQAGVTSSGQREASRA